jgi:hypothetical protein
MASRLSYEKFSTAQNSSGGAIQDRRGVNSAAALEFYAGTAGALGISGRLFGRGGGRCGGRGFGRRQVRNLPHWLTKRIEAGFAVALR